MARTNSALVNPAILLWARVQVRMTSAVAAKKAAVTSDKLSSWETGTARPTLRQARALAHAYRLPLAAFYLPEPPKTKSHVPKDYRRHAGTVQESVTTALALDIRDAWEKRDIAIELLALRGSGPTPFDIAASISDDPEIVGPEIRRIVGVSTGDQAGWRDARVAFNAWRGCLERHGVLVLQTSELPASEVRAYSLFAERYPVVVVNRKDPAAARSFSLIHELTHLALKADAVCDLSTAVERAPEEQKLEVFCNAVAAAFLMPREPFLGHAIVRDHGTAAEWSDEEIGALARHFSVSREAVLRRLLTFGQTSDAFYSRKREEYKAEYARARRKGGPVAPPIDALSLLGRPFVRLVLDSLDSERITSTDASDYLGLRLKHLPALTAALEGE